MIEFEEALNLVLKNTPVLPPGEKKVDEVHGDILAEDIMAGEDHPLFSNSAMDGFALRAEDTLRAPVRLKVTGCLKAGDAPKVRVRKGEAIKIMTGAALPGGADAVVMKEETEEKGNGVLVRKSVKAGENVRKKGEEIKKGQLALSKGKKLNTASIGFLASMGHEKVKVVQKPVVSLVVTGKELVNPGRKLKPGQIWESNSLTIQESLKEVAIEPVFLGISRDNTKDLEKRIRKGLESSDVLLISGGISVGDYDFVQDILLNSGVTEIFWRVAVKPGKPIFFGRKDKTLVFGLPGNPVSVLVAFLEFVQPVLLKMRGHRDLLLPEKEAVLEEPVKKERGRLQWFKGIYTEENGIVRVKSAGLQHSHILESLSRANCLIVLEKGREFFKAGEKVKIQVLPWG